MKQRSKHDPILDHVLQTITNQHHHRSPTTNCMGTPIDDGDDHGRYYNSLPTQLGNCNGSYNLNEQPRTQTKAKVSNHHRISKLAKSMGRTQHRQRLHDWDKTTLLLPGQDQKKTTTNRSQDSTPDNTSHKALHRGCLEGNIVNH